MNLFRYNPTPFVNTQVDLPLDFIQGQLETKQKEFDLQNAAVDKAAENFLKMNHGMLTKDAYDRVMKQYLPQLEKIRDTLVSTGNVSMAAPELSKFTMNLAADPEVKKIMEDRALTDLHQKALAEGKYSEYDYGLLYGPNGEFIHPQLQKGQSLNPLAYAPSKYNDPVDLLKEDVQKFKAEMDDEMTEWRDKDGRLMFDKKYLKNDEIPKILPFTKFNIKNVFLPNVPAK